MFLRFLTLASLSVITTSCFHTHDSTAGWEYNNANQGGFRHIPIMEQETAPDMMVVAGSSWAKQPLPGKRDTAYCHKFYISRYEETNRGYYTYLGYLKKYYSKTTYQKALPDTTVWLRETNLSNYEKTLLYTIYHWHPAFEDFPVVGVSPEQVKAYANWKSDRLNEFILIREGVIEYHIPADSTEVFTTEGYLAGTYNPSANLSKLHYSERPEQRIVRMEDGILLPRFRPVLFSEWVRAAYAIGDSSNVYIQTQAETPFEKNDRENQFGYLKIKPVKPKKYSSEDPAVGRVYSGDANAHGIYRLYDGVSELVQHDSLTFGVAGGNWKIPENYAATYHSTGNFTGYYTFPQTVKSPAIIGDSVKGIYGFRLAMDHYGWE